MTLLAPFEFSKKHWKKHPKVRFLSSPLQNQRFSQGFSHIWPVPLEFCSPHAGSVHGVVRRLHFIHASLGAYGSYGFSDIGSGTGYGSVTISSGGIVSVTLNASALADISAAQGGTFSLGGVHSGEISGSMNFDFGGIVGDASSTQLILNTSSAAVPEPTTLAIFGIGAGIAGLKARRRKRAV